MGSYEFILLSLRILGRASVAFGYALWSASLPIAREDVRWFRLAGGPTSPFVSSVLCRHVFQQRFTSTRACVHPVCLYCLLCICEGLFIKPTALKDVRQFKGKF